MNSKWMLAGMLITAVAGESAPVQVQAVVFGERQLLQDELGRAKATPVKASLESPSIAVMPFHMKSYSESIPCDSCHRLSPNGFEFFLENYLVGMADTLLTASPSNSPARLIAPHHEILQSNGVDLMGRLDNLSFPLKDWFYGYSEPLIYRSRDTFSSDSLKKKLDALGGALGVSHLLLPVEAEIHVKPKSSSRHVGDLTYGFHLILWNARLGRPEWVVAYREELRGVDLNKSLDSRLDRNLKGYLEGLPRRVAALRAAEPK